MQNLEDLSVRAHANLEKHETALATYGILADIETLQKNPVLIFTPEGNRLFNAICNVTAQRILVTLGDRAKLMHEYGSG